MSSLVQAIAVVPGSHYETIRATAIASALSLPVPVEGVWEEWLAQDYRKSVRKAKPSKIETLEGLSGIITSARIGKTTALAYQPMFYEDFPKPLKRLQVSGLECARIEEDRGVKGVEIFLNETIEMSTGKASAQAAHALGLWLLQAPEREALKWRRDPQVRISPLGNIEEVPELLIVRDNGHTEVAPGTITAAIKV